MMKRIFLPISLAVLLCLVASSAVAQRSQHDPLTEKEVDQMREAADYPNKRLELIIGFAKERLTSIDQLRADSGAAAARPKKIHDLLEDFLTLIDETSDNVEMYESHRADMRKGLKLLIEAGSEWQLKLRQLKEQSSPEELAQYSFALTNAADGVSDMAKDARDTLQEQNKLAQEKQLIKDYSLRKD